MSYFGTGFRVKEGLIKRIERIDMDGHDKIRLVVKSSIEGNGLRNRHAMLNIEDDTFVSDERFHSIITTYKDLSDYIKMTVDEENKESLYNTTILFSRYAKDIFSTLQDVSKKTKAFPFPHSSTINNPSLRVDYDWLYASRLDLNENQDRNETLAKKIFDYIKDNIGKKYLIGNFRTTAMQLTAMSKDELDIMAKAMEESKKGYWKIHSPHKLCYQNQYHKLPEYTFEYNYTIIGDGAFRGFHRLDELTLPATVKYIGVGAFESCTAMKRIKLPTGLLDIGNCCFSNCQSLDNIIVPNTVEEIGSYAFSDCKSLYSIIMPDHLSYIGRHAFDGCPEQLKIFINEKYKDELSVVLKEYYDNIEVINDFNIRLRRGTLF